MIYLNLFGFHTLPHRSPVVEQARHKDSWSACRICVSAVLKQPSFVPFLSFKQEDMNRNCERLASVSCLVVYVIQKVAKKPKSPPNPPPAHSYCALKNDCWILNPSGMISSAPSNTNVKTRFGEKGQIIHFLLFVVDHSQPLALPFISFLQRRVVAKHKPTSVKIKKGTRFFAPKLQDVFRFLCALETQFHSSKWAEAENKPLSVTSSQVLKRILRTQKSETCCPFFFLFLSICHCICLFTFYNLQRSLAALWETHAHTHTHKILTGCCHTAAWASLCLKWDKTKEPS